MRFLAIVAALIGCHRDTPRTSESGELNVRVISEPITVARVWSTALVPNKRGGWNFIAQTYEYQSEQPTEFVVLDLQSGAFTIDEGPSGAYANSNYQIDEQLRAPNGRVFFPELENRIAYYDPEDERVHQLPPIIDPAGGDKMIYRLVFGPDGLLYGGTQSNHLPTIFQLDPQTLKARNLGKVGAHRINYSYAYYLAVDLPWIYVAVGEDPWELVASNVTTGGTTILATRGGDGFMQLDTRSEGITATLVSGLRTANQHSEIVWCIDGTLVPFQNDVTQRRFKPRVVKPHDNPISKPPEVELSSVTPDANGVGHVRWRDSSHVWHTATYKVKHTAAIPIESLVALPDGSLLGNARQYHGFFRFDPRSKRTEVFGDFKLSGGPRLVVGDRVLMSGYPNAPLYSYDPRLPWSATNPQLVGAFTDSGTHYAYFLAAGNDGRIYYAGRRERDGVGTGVGVFDPKTGRFAGHHSDLSFLDPQGLFVNADRVVLSGRVRDDPSQSSHEARLVVFDRDLHELERRVVKPNLANTGELFPTTSPQALIGVVHGARGAVYRYDLATKKLLWKDFAVVGPATSEPGDHSLWIVIDGGLVRVDPETLELHSYGHIADVHTDDLLVWQGKHLYWAAGSQLREIDVPSNR